MASTINLALFGATGNSGTAVLEAALAMGYIVKIMVRTPSKVKIEHENLTVIQGEFDSVDAIKKTVSGSDHVCCVAGGPMGTGSYPPKLMENFVKLLVSVMKATPTVKAFSYQAGFIVATPSEIANNTYPEQIAAIRKGDAAFLEPNLIDHEEVLKYLEGEGKSTSYSTVVMMAPMLKAGEATRTLKAATSRVEVGEALQGVTFKEVAALTLSSLKDKSLDGTYVSPSE